MKKGETSRDINGMEARLSRASVDRLSLYLRRLEGFRARRHDQGLQQPGRRIAGDHQRPGPQRPRLPRQPGPSRHRLSDPRTDRGHPAPLGIDRAWRTVLVGVGNLAPRLLRYRGFNAAGVSDSSPCSTPTRRRSARKSRACRCTPPERMAEVVAATNAELGLVQCRAGRRPRRVADDAGRGGHPRYTELRPNGPAPAGPGQPGVGGLDRPVRAACLSGVRWASDDDDAWAWNDFTYPVV